MVDYGLPIISIQGEHACHNKRLLKDILRDEWGFDGVVVSDWGGVHHTEQSDLQMVRSLEFGSYMDGTDQSAERGNAYDNYFLSFLTWKLTGYKSRTKELDEKG